jgi:hypothetical protein
MCSELMTTVDIDQDGQNWYALGGKGKQLEAGRWRRIGNSRLMSPHGRTVFFTVRSKKYMFSTSPYSLISFLSTHFSRIYTVSIEPLCC